MKFSERYGHAPPKEIQLACMDDQLKVALWNAFVRQKDKLLRLGGRVYGDFACYLWDRHFHLPVSKYIDVPIFYVEAIEKIFNAYNWMEVYDFIEATLQATRRELIISYVQDLNQTLEREKSGYRIAETNVTPITSETDLEAITKALRGPVMAVNEHLGTSLELYSNRRSPDYRNSIKESISAVETLCCLITNKPKGTLGEALGVIDSRLSIHPALKRGFDSIYGYASDESGIRHKMIEESTLDDTDALFMLTSCSAFINYLVDKANKAGVLLRQRQ